MATTDLAPATAGVLAERHPDDPARALAVAFLLGYTGHTRRAYARDLTDWSAWCAQHGPDVLAVRRPHVEAYARSLTEVRGLASSTVARRLTTLAGFYRYAVAEEVLTRSPVEHVRRPKVGTDSQTTGLDRDEARRLLAAARADGPRSFALVSLLTHNGLRVSEALGADVEDLGAERGHRTLTILGKGGRRAVVAIAPATGAAIDDYLAGRTDGPLFATSTGRRLDEPYSLRLTRRLAAAAGLPQAAKLSPHSLRHTAITAALDAGVPLRDVQDFARHSDPRMTRRYDRARGNLDRAASYAVTAYLADVS